MSTGNGRPCLVLGSASDPHTLAMERELRRHDCSIQVLDVWSAWPALTLELTAEGGGLVRPKMTPRSVWLRLKPRLGGLPSEEDAFVVRERSEFVTGLMDIFESSTLFVNAPGAQERARHKIVQLRAAQDIGLRVPCTWISSDNAALAQQARLSGSIIYKPLSWLATLDGSILFTNSVTQAQLECHAEAVRCAPGIYQEQVPKACEYRVTIVEGELFPVRIYSQARTDTLLDWRRNQTDLRYEACTLGKECEGLLLGLMTRLGLRFGAVDLIERPDGEIVFLEINPGGNWLWLEERLALGVTAALAQLLAGLTLLAA